MVRILVRCSDSGAVFCEIAYGGPVNLIDLDTILLSSAMFALGVATRWHHLKAAGTKPLLLAFLIFAGLVTGGWMITRLLV